MQKIISLFCRNYESDRLVRDEIVPGAEWVVNGEGVPTRKWDGTACLIRDGKLYKRYDAKRGRQPPLGFIPAQEPDETTGHWPGWVAVGDKPEDRWHREAWKRMGLAVFDGTYELVGPRVQANAERWDHHTLLRHGSVVLGGVPRDFAGIKAYLARTPGVPIEGIVWHHPDGRMVKIKRRDFGLAWPVK